MRDLLRRASDPQAVTRKRFARRQWARRWLVWRYLVAAVVALALVATGVWLVFFSSVLAVSGVDVQGTSVLSQTEVAEAADVPDGRPLARVDVASIRDRVEELPAVESADVSRKWPDEIRIDVVERTMVAVVPAGGGYRGLDGSGVIFRTLPNRPPRVPLIRTEPDVEDEVLTEGARVAGVLPRRVLRRVEYVEVHSVDEISLALRDGRTVRWGSAEHAEEKAKVLPALLRQPGTVYNVTVPDQPTVR